MEVAKRRALFTPKALSLPSRNIKQDPQVGLSFDFTTDCNVSDNFVSKLINKNLNFDRSRLWLCNY
jgi:hypothetical protein